MNYSNNIRDLTAHPRFHGKIGFGMHVGHYIEALHYDMLDAWWKGHNVPGPSRLQTPQDSTFIVYNGLIPMASLSIILTNVKDYCFVENLISNPDISDYKLKAQALNKLDVHATAFVKNLGYKKIIAMVSGDRPEHRATMGKIGFQDTNPGVIMIREVV